MTSANISILLVEDVPADAELVRIELQEESNGLAFDITHVETLAAAIDHIQQHGESIDVVLLDLGLPDARGTQALWRVLGIGAHLPVIVLTGLEDRAVGVEAVRLGAQDYLTKGLTNAALLTQSVRHAIERAGRTEQLVREIEARNAAEEQLRRSEQRLRDFGEAASDWFWETDAASNLVFISDRFFDWSGYEPEQILQPDTGDALSTPSRTLPWLNRLETSGRQEAFRAWQIDLPIANGSVRRVSLSGKPLFDGDGRFQGYRGTGADVTAFLAAQDELDRLEGFLHRSVENLHEGFALYDADERLVLCNARFRELYPALSSQLQVGTEYEDLVRAHAYSGSVVEAQGREETYVADRLAQHRNSTGPFERQLADGRWLMVHDQQFEGGSCVAATDITPLKLHESELQRSAETIDAIFRNMDQGIAMIDRAFRLVAFNNRYLELVGLPADIVARGVPVDELVRFRVLRGDYGPGNPDDIVESRMKRLRNRKPQAYEFPTPDGRIVEMHGRPTPEGGYVATYTDVTERSRREQEMSLLLAAGQEIASAGDAEDALSAVLRVIGEAMGWAYAESWKPDANDEFLILSEPWLAGNPEVTPFREISRTMTFAPGVGLAGRVWQRGQAEWIRELGAVDDNTFRRRDAAVQAGLKGALCVPVRGSVGKVLAVLCFYMFEVRGSEERLIKIVEVVASQLGTLLEKKLAEDALRESEDRFRAFAETASDFFIILDENLRFSYLSDRTCDVLGIDPKNVLGADRGSLFGLVPEQEEALAEYRRCLEAHEPYRDFEYAVYDGEGQIRHIRSSGRPRFDSDGKFCGYFTVGTDITGQKQLETQLQQAQKMEAVGQLTGGVAHDFNNLLTVVMGNLQLLERRLKGDARTEKQIGMALDAVRRGSELTRRLLAFSRRQVLAPKNADANALVDGMVPLLQRTLGEAIKLDIRQERSLWTVRVDAAQFESALLNLAVNARDAMPKGGRLLIETKNTTLDKRYSSMVPGLDPGGYVSVSVSDTGTGIPKVFLDRVFEPFFTTKEVGKGSGLGLSMVFGFVKQSKGHVTIYSEDGQGTTIRLYFPRVEAGSAPVVDLEVEPEAPSGSETILIVEDERAVRETLTLMLEDYGYSIVTAEDGPSALATLEKGITVDLLLTDVVMPGGMNGREVSEQALKLRPGLKVLITSGYPQETITHNGILDEGIAFIAKPYEHGDLARKIRDVLDG